MGRQSYLIKRKTQVFTDRQQPLGSSGFKRRVRPLAHPAQLLFRDASVFPVVYSLLLFFPKANYLMFSVTEIHCLPERRGSVTGQTSPQFDRAGMTLPAVPSSSSLCLSEPVKSDWDREKINGFSGHCFKNKSRVDEQNITLLFEQKANICQERAFLQACILRSVFADLPL